MPNTCKFVRSGSSSAGNINASGASSITSA